MMKTLITKYPSKRLIIDAKKINMSPATISWIDVWKPQSLNIIILFTFIFIVSGLLFFKDIIAKNRSLYSFKSICFII